MNLPVLIAARNEASNIGETLSHLDLDTVTPYVIVNGSTDNTAEIARSHIKNVYEIHEASKMRAIQYGLKILGPEALGPVLYTDADSRPLFPRQWAATMVRGLGDARVGVGLLAASDGSWLERMLISELRIANSFEKYIRGKTHVAGANMITRIDDYETLDRVLRLDNFGQGEDTARSDAILQGDRPKAILNPAAMVLTSSRFKPSPLQIFLHGKQWAREASQADTISRQAPGTKTYKID